jgi:hypothetical protein
MSKKVFEFFGKKNCFWNNIKNFINQDMIDKNTKFYYIDFVEMSIMNKQACVPVYYLDSNFKELENNQNQIIKEFLKNYLSYQIISDKVGSSFDCDWLGDSFLYAKILRHHLFLKYEENLIATRNYLFKSRNINYNLIDNFNKTFKLFKYNLYKTIVKSLLYDDDTIKRIQEYTENLNRGVKAKNIKKHYKRCLPFYKNILRQFS